MTRVGVLGAGGRMGSEACRAVDAADDLELVARIGSTDPLTALTDAGVEIAVDLTRPDAVMDHLRFCVEHGIHAVVGTSGFDDDRLAQLRGWLDSAPADGYKLFPTYPEAPSRLFAYASRRPR